MLQNKHAVIYLLPYTRVYTVCLHLEQAFETVLEKMKMIQMSLKKHSLYNLNWSCFEQRVACANKLRCVVLQLLCKIIEKSVMGESFFFCLTRLDPRLGSRFTQESRIVNRVENRDSQRIVNFLLNSTIIEDLRYFQRLMHQKLPGPLQNLPPSVVICWSPLS